MIEQWRDINGYKGLYMASDHGRVKSLARCIVDGNQYQSGYIRHVIERILVQSKVNKSGHRVVALSRDGVVKQCLVHRLVFDAFIGPPPKVLNHIDNKPENNRLENIEASSSVHNARHAIDNGFWLDKGSDNPNSKLNEDEVIYIRMMNGMGRTLTAIAKVFEVSSATISLICANKTWKHV